MRVRVRVWVRVRVRVPPAVPAHTAHTAGSCRGERAIRRAWRRLALSRASAHHEHLPARLCAGLRYVLRPAGPWLHSRAPHEVRLEHGRGTFGLPLDHAQKPLVCVGADALAAQTLGSRSRHKSSELNHGRCALLRAQILRAAATHSRDEPARRQQGYDHANRERRRQEAEELYAHWVDLRNIRLPGEVKHADGPVVQALKS